MRAALGMLQDWQGRRVAILGDMLELGEGGRAAHRDIAALARQAAECTVFVGPLFAEAFPAAAGESAGSMSAHADWSDAMVAQVVALLRIPRQAGHRFHGKLDSDSTARWTPIPGQAGHLK